MKKILLSMAALLVLGSSVSVDAQRHRHTPRTENVVSASSAKKMMHQRVVRHQRVRMRV